MLSCKFIIWQYGLWSFQMGDIKLERFLPKNQHTPRKLLNFEFWINGELSNSDKIWLSKSIFYVKNHPILSQFFFIEKYRFRSTCFDSSPLIQNSKFNNFLRICWFLGKNLSNFVLPFENSTTRTAINVRE